MFLSFVPNYQQITISGDQSFLLKNSPVVEKQVEIDAIRPMESHNTAVRAIEDSVRRFHDLQRPFRVYHGATNSTRESRRQLENSVDTSKLTRVLHVDKEKMTVITQANCPMDVLLQTTLAHGLVPLIVMEFPGITVGGGFAGTAGESSSFRYGFFDNTVNWIEIVLAEGRTVKASRWEQPEIFWGAASSFGTLGVVTLLEVQLRRASPYVELTYFPFSDIDAALKTMRAEISNEKTDYLDGIVYSQDNMVVCSGTLCDKLPAGAEVQQFTRPRDPWFYIHAQRRTKAGSGEPVTVYVPLTDYLFRYDRGAFWTGRYAFKYFITPFNRITRYVLDRFMHTRVMYHALHKSGHSKKYIIQDVAIPYEGVTEFHDWLDSNFGIYPIWICPLRQRRDDATAKHGLYSVLADQSTPEYMLNFGVWGPGSNNRRKFIDQNRLLEHKVDELGGRKWLYAHTYYTESEFWSIYDRQSYDALRAKYSATYLPNVYDKVRVHAEAEEAAIQSSWILWLQFMLWSIWPLSGLYGVWKVIMGGDYLLQKRSPASAQATKQE